jgi:Ca2+-binding EF-hand superfamily protein
MKGNTMTLRYRICAAGLLAGLIVAGGGTAAFAKDTKASCPAFKAIDPDNDGKLDLNEAKAAASKLFDNRDTDKDGTVTAKELQGRLSKKDLAAGDPDKDGTLTKDEYLAIVESRFKAANPDTDGTIDCKEAKSKAGRELLRLLK